MIQLSLEIQLPVDPRQNERPKDVRSHQLRDEVTEFDIRDVLVEEQLETYKC